MVGFFSQPLVGGFSDRWSMVPLVGGRLFLGKWSVVGGFVLRRFPGRPHKTEYQELVVD